MGPGRIAYLTGEYPRATDTFIQREVAALRHQGREVATFSIRRTGPEHHVGPEQVAEAAATFNVLPAAKNPARLIAAHVGALLRSPARYLRAIALAAGSRPPGIRGALFQLFYFLEAGVLADQMQRQGIGHLHNHIAKQSCNVAMLASEMSGIPFSFTLHGPDIFFAPEHWRLDRKIEKARFVACISHFCRAQGMAFSSQDHWQKLHIIHCGVDPARYSPGRRDPAQQVLFVGRLAAVKGVPILLHALEALRDVKGLQLDLIGDGPDRAALEAQAHAMGLQDRVRFLGYRSQDEVADALTRADLFVLPSFAEGVPVVLMEAMAAGVPVVTTRIAGIPELVEDGISGRLVPPGDVDALTTAIRGMFDEPAQARKMGQAGRAVVAVSYDAEVEACRLGVLFDAYAGIGAHPPIRPEVT
ncbi:glycosyltransferase family 4 protein [Shimia biformata]|uniref:glycosyltransferase family 4 protein n=1 Tax=Shimia biformata TaxID=1294299 RepID=UPI00194DD9DC|nr:glycosyltransferase family 4 protein [Shimia biformata]